MREPMAADLIAELDTFTNIAVAAIVKTLAEETGESHGEIPCPRCQTGTLKWSVAESNGHAAVRCSREVGRRDGRSVRCVNAME